MLTLTSLSPHPHLTLTQVAKKGEEGFLVWDKDDLPALNFVTACANIRMHIFNIPQKTRSNLTYILTPQPNIKPAPLQKWQMVNL